MATERSKSTDTPRLSLLAPEVARWPADATEPMIALRDVWVSFGEHRVLRGLNLDIYGGETTVIMGESGSGKSILLKLIIGLMKPDKGSVRVFGHEVAELSQTAILSMRKRVGMLFQNYALMDSVDVRTNIAFPVFENTSMPEPELSERVRDLLELLDLPGAYGRSPNALSGGMKKRVGLARALITNPELVLFDEPTTGLDPVMIEFVDGLIAQAQRAYNVTSVIISHDVSSVFRLADRIAMLHEGQIIEVGAPEAIRASRHPWVSRFLGVGGSGRMRADEGAGAHESAVCDDVDARLAAEPAEPVVKLMGIWKSFGDNTVLKGVNLNIQPKMITVLIGGSGSGKSVLIKHIIGLFQPTSGQVVVRGIDITDGDPHKIAEVRQHFGMLFQGAALFDSMSVRDNVGFALVERRLTKPREVRERVDEMLERLKIPDIADRFPMAISNGQKKRVALARALITHPEVMIYDEPTTGQDPIMIRYVDDMIEEAQQEFDITSIVISHDMVSTFRIADRIAMLYKGQILAYGTPDELRQTQVDRCSEFIFAGSFGG